MSVLTMAEALKEWATENLPPSADFETKLNELIAAVKTTEFSEAAVRIIVVYQDDMANVPDGEVVAIHYNRSKSTVDGYDNWAIKIIFADREIDLPAPRHTSADVMWQCAMAVGAAPKKDIPL